MVFYMLILHLCMVPLLQLSLLKALLLLVEILSLQDKYGVLSMAILVISITENFIVILVMMQIMIISSHISLIMVSESIQVSNIIELQEKQNLKIITIFNGQKILLKDKQVTSSILEMLKLKILPNIQKTHRLYYVLMMLNYMVIGGMKDLIGYIFYLRKSIMMIAILN